jgi:hypothetical protein
MKRLMRAIQGLLLVAAFLPMVSALAEQPRGFYMGVGVGDAEADISVGDLDQLFRDAFREQNGTFTPQVSSIDTKNSHLYIFAGYRVFPWLSAEGGYVDLGGFDYVTRGTAFTPANGTQQINLRMKIKSQGIALNALGNLPLSDYFEMHARLGFFGVNTEGDVTGGTSSRPIDVSESGFSFSFQFGLGAAVNVGDHFSLSADWVRYFEIDSNESSEDADNYDYDGFDVSVLRLSAIVRF